MFIKYAGILIGAYLLGSLSLSILVSGALFGKDIRTEGSGNAGAPNMARVFGWGAGLLTLAGDAAKLCFMEWLGHSFLFNQVYTSLQELIKGFAFQHTVLE